MRPPAHPVVHSALPSEAEVGGAQRGHRLLARGFGELLTAAGTPVPHPVDLDLDGGRRVTAVHHVGWLVFKGVPWLCRRGRDLLPHAAALVVRELVSRR